MSWEADIANSSNQSSVVTASIDSRNESSSEALAAIRLNYFKKNQSVSDEVYIALIIMYSLLSFTGIVGNTLVCAVVLWKPHMRTVRNMLIFNLAVSDLILCLFTMPFSLVQIITKYWHLGLAICKCVAGLQATSVFVSTMSITAIAVDRYAIIVHPTNASMKSFGASLTIVIIWLTALLLSTPLFVFRTVDHYELNLTDFPSVDFCVESWPIDKGAAIYSLSTMLFQYLFPIVSISFTHIQICRKLRFRIMRKKRITNKRDASKDEKKTKRTNNLLLAIAFVFAITWLPLNIVNISADFGIFDEPRETFYFIFGLCHMFGMTSACSNPIFYGWFNENFRREFWNILRLCRIKKTNRDVVNDVTMSTFPLNSEIAHRATTLHSEI